MRRLARARWVFVAGALTAAAGLVFIVSERAAAFAFSPTYSYAVNYISDLGLVDCGQLLEGRPVCSPLHVLMNAAFISEGALFLAAALVTFSLITGSLRYVFVALVGAHAVGGCLIGIFHEATATQAIDAQASGLHLLGAALSIICGNAAILAAAPLWSKLGLPLLNRTASIVLPIAGYIALVILSIDRAHGTMFIVPDGIWERGSVYTITLWQIFTGASLMIASRRL